MKKNLFIWGTALILVIVAIVVTKSSGNSKVETTQPVQSTVAQSTAPSQTQSTLNNLSGIDNTSSDKAIDFTLTDLDGKKVSLSDYKGKNVYLNFFATWCPPCRGEMPDIEKIYKQYKDKDLVVLVVDLGENKNTVKDFIDKNKYTFRVALDSNKSVAEQYNITSIPVSYFIDKNGNIATKRVGALTNDEMQSYVKALIDKK